MSKAKPLELDVGGRAVQVSSPDKVLFPKDGITKADLADYYARVADTMLPHLEGRPISMLRYPDGIDGESFFQKDVPDYFPDWIRRAKVEKEGGTLEMMIAEEPAALVYLASQACVTPHVWLSRIDRPQRPDRLIFDFDPPGNEFGPVRDGARRMRDLLEELGLVPYVMTTGSRGLHVTVPLDRSANFDQVRAFARGCAELLVRRRPEQLTVEHRKAKRRGRVYIDTGRNAYAQTGVAPYAVRALPGAPVAAPLDWSELGRARPRSTTLANLFRRLGRKDDPWADMGRKARPLARAAGRLERIQE
ncbi:MAG TPA: non-homologous end-joining DNA ligase [Gemmatimonadota bacterium]|nr:non-homologous end-joining DNA ligase [Gemmatimonadota bacterium]